MGALKTIILILYVSLVVSSACQSRGRDDQNHRQTRQPVQSLVDTSGSTILERFNPPPGFRRLPMDTLSFGYYLRHLPLKQYGTPVRYYDGREKSARNVYISVVDLDIGNRDLQQCADAIMRLRSEYLFARQKYEDIHFNFISDGQPRYYEEYIEGDYSYAKFRTYLDYIFSSANTRSLSQELISVGSIFEMQAGDVFIQTGNPYGHAIIVVDMAEDASTGEKVYMLLQSYMPAQDMHVLVNPNNIELSPWYSISIGQIVTPEWIFQPIDLKRFED